MWALILVPIAVVAAGLGLLVWRAPAKHTARMSAVIPASPEAVWASIEDVDAQRQWRGLKALSRVGDRLEETDARGDVLAMRIEVEDPPRKRVTRIVDNRSFGGTWTWTLSPDPGGTKVEIVEEGEIYNPVFRVLAPLLHDNEATMRQVLEGLSKHHGG